jgi:hypothetical protein
VRDLLFNIPSELAEDMRSNNIIESITIKLVAIVKMDSGLYLLEEPLEVASLRK